MEREKGSWRKNKRVRERDRKKEGERGGERERERGNTAVTACRIKEIK